MRIPVPIGAPSLWTAVVDRDSGQCTCTGGCGRRHAATAAERRAGRRDRGPGANAVRDPVVRCTAGRAGERLLVVPADPTVRDSDAWKLPATALTTRCEPCARGAAAHARRAPTPSDPLARETDALAPGQTQLTLLDPLDGTAHDSAPTTAPRKAGPR